MILAEVIKMELFYNVNKKECIWHSSNLLRHILVLPCSIMKTNAAATTREGMMTRGLEVTGMGVLIFLPVKLPKLIEVLLVKKIKHGQWTLDIIKNTDISCNNSNDSFSH